jgi:hypothetical protein
MKTIILLIFVTYVLCFFAGTAFLVEKYNWSCYWFIITFICVVCFKVKDYL